MPAMPRALYEQGAALPAHRELTTADMAANIADLQGAVNTAWVLSSGFLVFLMQAGFTLLEAGFSRTKNTQSVVMKNAIDAAIGAICWTICGWGLAFGKDSGGLFGSSAFLVTPKDLHPGSWHLFFYQWTFNATTATILSGALAERTRMTGYTIIAVMCCAFYQPIVAHWAWCEGGFLYTAGYVDFAGSGVVHMLGGIIAVVGAAIVGPRTGRFPTADKPVPDIFTPTSVLHICLGTFLLWFGWFGFNGGSTLGLTGGSYVTSARVCVCTTISAATGACSVFFLHKALSGEWDITQFANGILAGLVGITAGCSNMDTMVSALIGIISGPVYIGASKMLESLKIDDAVGAFPVHGACGAWGVLAAGLFDLDKGALNGGDALGTNIKGLVCIALFAVAGSAPVYIALKGAGLLRTTDEEEEAGLDSHFAHSPRHVEETTAKMNGMTIEKNMDMDVPMQMQGDAEAPAA